MSQRANATFQVKSWEEQPNHEIDNGPELTRASVTKTFSGGITGDGILEYLMMHRTEGSASFIRLERVVGRVGDRLGSFVLQHSGTFEGGIAKATWFVVPGSGAGDLQGLRGEGGFTSAHAEHCQITLDYDFE